MTRKRGKSRSRRVLRQVGVLPSLVTLLNAVCGFAAIHFTARAASESDKWLQQPELTYFAAAAWMIFLAMVADALDGFVARRTGSAGNFGAQLDSLADGISFGVAPAFLMLRVVECTWPGIVGPHLVTPVSPAFATLLGRLLWLVAAMYVCCTLLRLARFTVETGPSEADHMGFSGLPSPAAAGVVASLVLLYGDFLPELEAGGVGVVSRVLSPAIIVLLPLVTVAAGLLMVSRIPYRHILNQYIRGRRPFGHVVRVVILTLLLIWKPQLTLAAAFVAYASTSPVRAGYGKWLSRRSAAPSQAGPEPVEGPVSE